MLISAAKQIEKHLAAMLVNVKTGKASTSDMCETLALSKTLSSQLAVFQTVTATTIAERENHTDKGMAILRTNTGISKHKARKQIKTSESLNKMPTVRETLEEGKITPANAAALAEASRKTNPRVVQTDKELLGQAQTMPDDMFARRVKTWTAQHQHDHGEADYKRMRAKRSIRIWDGTDGMTHLHGMFDPITGARIRNRLNRSALRQYRRDKKHQATQPDTTASHKTNNYPTGPSGNWTGHNSSSRINGSGNRISGSRTNGSSGDTGRRSFEQCLADVFEKLVNNTGNNGGGTENTSSSRSNPVAEILVYADISTLESHNTNKNNTNLLGLEDLQTINDSHNNASINDSHNNGHNNASINGNNGNASINGINGNNGNNGNASINGNNGNATINGNHSCCDDSINRFRIEATTNNNGTGSHSCFGSVNGIGELADGTPIPPSILDQLMCSSPRLTGLLFNGPGRPLWCGRSKRVITAAQLKALKLRDRHCVGCGAHHSMCQAHHIIPWSKGGKTNLDNLVLVCYECHHKIHENNWQITTQNNHFTLQPPNPQPWKPPKTSIPNHHPEPPNPHKTTTRNHQTHTKPPPGTTKHQNNYNPQKENTNKNTTT